MYAFLGIKWGDPELGTPSGTITWSSDIADDLTHSSTYRDGQFDAALEDAFERWEDVAAVDFVRVSSGADVNVAVADFSGSIVGFATTFADPSPGIFNEATGALVEFDISDRFWSPRGSSDFSEVNFFAVALHEIGHVLGLDHPDTASTSFPGEIMNSFIAADDLGEGDKAGAQILYGTDGSDTPVDTSGGVSGGEDGGGGGGAGLGLIAGLLALLFGLFTGGAGAAAVAAAARIADDDDALEPDVADAGMHPPGCGCGACGAHDHAGHEHGYDVLADGTIRITHATTVPDLPLVDFDYASFDSGDDETDATADDFLLS